MVLNRVKPIAAYFLLLLLLLLNPWSQNQGNGVFHSYLVFKKMVTGVVFKNIGTTGLVFKNIGSGLLFKNMCTGVDLKI
jgi:hypothetical protein